MWVDEGLSVGIADRPLGDIPAALRLDGSPPLYYVLLHLWMAVVGRSEAATHALSLVFAALAVPAAWWAARVLFGPRAGWIGGAAGGDQPVPDAVRAGDADVRAGDPARHARVRLLRPRVRVRGTVDARSAAGAGRSRFAVVLAAMLYTHNWALFFAAGCGAAWLGLLAAAPPSARRALLVDGLIGFGGALLLLRPVAAHVRSSRRSTPARRGRTRRRSTSC